MKKLLVILAVLIFTAGMVFAARGVSTTPAKGTAQETKTSTSNSNYVMETSKAQTYVHHGDVASLAFEGPILVTSFGQSTDTDSLGAVFMLMSTKDKSFTYTKKNSITADEVKNYKTIIIVTGMSTKGLGAAGISEADELARCQKILEETKKQGTTVVLAHVGGVERRGVGSDKLTDMVVEQAKYMMVVEAGNDDYKFTNIGKNKNIPYTLVLKTDSIASFFSTLVKK